MRTKKVKVWFLENWEKIKATVILRSFYFAEGESEDFEEEEEEDEEDVVAEEDDEDDDSGDEVSLGLNQ